MNARTDPALALPFDALVRVGAVLTFVDEGSRRFTVTGVWDKTILVFDGERTLRWRKADTAEMLLAGDLLLSMARSEPSRT